MIIWIVSLIRRVRAERMRIVCVEGLCDAEDIGETKNGAHDADEAILCAKGRYCQADCKDCEKRNQTHR